MTEPRTRSLLPRTLLIAALALVVRPSGRDPAILRAGDAPAPHPSFVQDPVWDDGQAEVSTYRITRPFYGETWEGEATFVIVKEPWVGSDEVKADDASRATGQVLKLHRLEEVVTRYYPYRFATTCFVERRGGLPLVKIASTSGELCGTTYQGWRASTGLHEWRSYFEAEGSGTRSVRPGGGLVLWEDALPLQLRGLHLEEGVLGRATLVSSLVSNHARPLGLRTVELVAAREGGAWRVELREPGGERVLGRLWFSLGSEGVLRRAELGAGTTYDLLETGRRAYWPGG
jgi:hypothetical protein